MEFKWLINKFAAALPRQEDIQFFVDGHRKGGLTKLFGKWELHMQNPHTKARGTFHANYPTKKQAQGVAERVWKLSEITFTQLPKDAPQGDEVKYVMACRYGREVARYYKIQHVAVIHIPTFSPFAKDPFTDADAQEFILNALREHHDVEYKRYG